MHSTTPPAQNHVSTPWLYRAWCQQASRLYASPEAQRLALLHRLELKMGWTTSPERLLWLHDIACHLNENIEVAP